MNFGSDNQTGTSKKIMDMLLKANNGVTPGYGEDEWTEKAQAKLEQIFEKDLNVFFVPTGTAANCLALSSMANPWDMVLCHNQAHIFMDESSAPEFFTGGARMHGLAHGDPKLLKSHLEDFIQTAGTDYPHNSRATVVSITQPNECGQIYSISEIKELSAYARKHNILLHMDGARFANALASLRCSPAEITWQAGVDILCLGATKCGAMMAEAVIIFNKELAMNFIYRRKRGGHLISKGRYFGAQFLAWLSDNHWLELADHANNMARKLSEGLAKKKNVRVVFPVKSNETFVIVKKKLAAKMEKEGAVFYEWYQGALPKNEKLKNDEMLIRLVTSFETTETEIEQFLKLI